MMQVYRSPFVEKTYVFYLDENNQVLDYKGWTLNRTDQTTVDPYHRLKRIWRNLVQ